MANYFSGFFHMTQALQQTRGRHQLRTWELMLAGSCAGVLFWCVALPLDCIKSRIQSQPLETSPRRSWLAALHSIDGVASLYRGWQVAFGRGIPGAAITLTVHHRALEWITQRWEQ
ncbi:hypothetical protein EMIHUDRAFT_251148 [Emiliania huxleyi CCMP1516]|uniref:Uncharacterized protein n=2 Tax=Emiliania huxleyi TaxID=2903 RepID=A0A0D3KXG7_EMIH1|nr:hypothetical protein EMIHUDRAFT_251148 [Emiliania huxleyi CCMP1516]EOD40452.1 hypothetical protein EMIHUDRAFT_251148 [Emiliania huxleyi CCMP1516]|eukprot:XP_005792881.1 hypothetical protein EMIHUDRAFT_251148 [Emiliania huxleyi CCMP1516]